MWLLVLLHERLGAVQQWDCLLGTYDGLHYRLGCSERAVAAKGAGTTAGKQPTMSTLLRIRTVIDTPTPLLKGVQVEGREGGSAE